MSGVTNLKPFFLVKFILFFSFSQIFRYDTNPKQKFSKFGREGSLIPIFRGRHYSSSAISDSEWGSGVPEAGLWPGPARGPARPGRPRADPEEEKNKGPGRDAARKGVGPARAAQAGPGRPAALSDL